MRNLQRMIGALVCLVLLAAYTTCALAVTVDYGRTGSLDVQLETSPLREDWSGVVFSLYRIGEIDNAGGNLSYATSGQFAASGVQFDYTTSSEAEAAARKLEDHVRRHSILPVAKQATDAHGVAKFPGLTVGVYFGLAEDPLELLDVTPFIVTVPYYQDGKLLYAVPVHPKSELKPTPSPSPSPSPTPSPTPTTTPGDLPQTGILRWPVIALSICGGLLILLGALAIARARREKKDDR